MPKTNIKYILASTVVAIAGLASIVGSINLIANISPAAFADEELPHCTNIRWYERWGSFSNATISSPINITEDEIISYNIPNQAERCKVEINLNGHTISEAYNGIMETRSNLYIGSNVEVIINGDGGALDYGTPMSRPCREDGWCMPENENAYTPNNIEIMTNNSNSKLIINDTTIISAYDSGAISIPKETTVELNNVTTARNTTDEWAETLANSVWNKGGTLTINGGSHNGIGTNRSGQTVINNATFKDIKLESGSSLTINGGTMLNRAGNPGGTIASGEDVFGMEYNPEHATLVSPPSRTNDITINGGNFENLNINTPATITGGTFINCKFDATEKFGGDTWDDLPDPAPTVVTGGTFVNSEFKDITTINSGVFVGSTLSEDTTVSGGTFDTIPEAENLPANRKVIENENGTFSVVDESIPGEEPIKPCEVRVYTDASTFTTFNTAINIDSDTVASIVVTDQDEDCRLVVNLNNGSTLTGVENMEAISVGNNVNLKVNGNHGEIKQNDDSTSDDTAVIKISDGATASIKEATISTNDEDGVSISNSGVTRLDNVTTEENTIKNTSGRLIISDSEIDNIESTDSSNVIIDNGEIGNVSASDNSTIKINGGEVTNITVEDNSSVQISDGRVESIEGDDTSNINISGGDFTDSNISSTSDNADNIIINGGTFRNTTFDSPITVVDGDFEDTEIPAGSVMPEEPNTNTDTNATTDVDTGEEGEIMVPDTGSATPKKDGGKQITVVTVVALEASFLVLCGYLLYRIRSSKKINFRQVCRY